jgi:short-subunit dehydrogenase
MGSYNVSKAGVVALSETMYAELKPHGVGVTVLCPGFFRSNLMESGRWSDARARSLGDRMVRNAKASADRVAQLALQAMDRKTLYVVHPLKARVLWRLKRWFPRSFHRVMAMAHRKWFP